MHNYYAFSNKDKIHLLVWDREIVVGVRIRLVATDKSSALETRCMELWGSRCKQKAATDRRALKQVRQYIYLSNFSLYQAKYMNIC